MKKLAYTITLFMLVISLTGCEKYFGDKTDIDFIEVPEFQAREVAYVPVFPFIDGFVYPTDVLAGFDELIYVVDSGTQSIYAFDESLRELGRIEIPGVRKVVQDRSLDLLAIGTCDTFNTQGVPYTLSCIYRINLKAGNGYGIQNATIKNKIVQPFY